MFYLICPNGAKLLVFKAYLYCGINASVYWILMLVIEFPCLFLELNILVFPYQPLGELGSLRASNSREATSIRD